MIRHRSLGELLISRVKLFLDPGKTQLDDFNVGRLLAFGIHPTLPRYGTDVFQARILTLRPVKSLSRVSRLATLLQLNAGTLPPNSPEPGLTRKL